MTHFFRGAILGLLLIALVIWSSSQHRDKRCIVFGTVTYGGQPLPKGSIAFAPYAGTRGSSAEDNVRNGRFRVLTVTPGKNIVTVRSDSIPAGAAGNGTTIDIPDEGLRDLTIALADKPGTK
jgi:hypothetical protein